MRGTDLIEHPEGGRYREVYRSSSEVRTAGGERRSSLTHIYFSLEPGEVSRFHRIRSDEVWNLYRGAGVRLFLWTEAYAEVETVELSARTGNFCHIVPGGTWQAAEPLCDAVLVGCSVAPGFEFAEFDLMTRGSVPAQALMRVRPDLDRLIAGGGGALRSDPLEG